MDTGTTRGTSLHRPEAARELGVESLCCLLHNLIVGGSARQWVNLLARHVEDGGRATIVAPAGPLSAEAREAGIETLDFAWAERPATGHDGLRAVLAGHDAAIVHWDHQVMDAFEDALEVCGRAVLALHQGPETLARWFGPQIVPESRAVVERALTEPRAVAVVRGEAHRERIATGFDLDGEQLRILPASIRIPAAAPRPAPPDSPDILALMRLSPEKSAIAGIAAELTGAGREAGAAPRLTIAGDGPWRSEAISTCEERLPPGSWRIEGAPTDSISRLAAADLVVAQGQTTLEAAALGRPVVVARTAPEGGPAGTVLTPENYESAARDPFGFPPLCRDGSELLGAALAVSDEQLGDLRTLVESHNSLEAGSRALAEALAATA